MSARRLDPTGDSAPELVTIRLDGEAYPARAGEPLAAALLASDVTLLSRSVKYHRPRGASCGVGHCTHCLVRVDGRPNVPACRTPCHEGLVAERQNTVGGADHDVLAATDWLFPRGLDHHEMFTGVPLVGGVVQRVVRELSGLGRLPDDVGSGPAHLPVLVDVLVVGGGRAGHLAAQAATDAGAEVLLCERGQRTVGHHPRAWTRAPVVMVARQPRLTAWVLRDDGIHPIHPGAIVFATGGTPGPGLFENNDLPGIWDATWAVRLLADHDVLVGERLVLCTDDDTLPRRFSARGATVVSRLPASAALDPAKGSAIRSALGGRRLEKVEVQRADGETVTLEADALVLDLPLAPFFDLPAALGATTGFDPVTGGFIVTADDDGQTDVPGVLVCGTVAGRRADARGPRQAGARAAEVARAS